MYDWSSVRSTTRFTPPSIFTRSRVSSRELEPRTCSWGRLPVEPRFLTAYIGRRNAAPSRAPATPWCVSLAALARHWCTGGSEALKQQCLAASVHHNTARTRPYVDRNLTYIRGRGRTAARHDKLVRN